MSRFVVPILGSLAMLLSGCEQGPGAEDGMEIQTCQVRPPDWIHGTWRDKRIFVDQQRVEELRRLYDAGSIDLIYYYAQLDLLEKVNLNIWEFTSLNAVFTSPASNTVIDFCMVVESLSAKVSDEEGNGWYRITHDNRSRGQVSSNYRFDHVDSTTLNYTFVTGGVIFGPLLLMKEE